MLKNAAILTRPTPACRDAPFSRLRSRVVQILNAPQRVRLRSSLAAALSNDAFERPVFLEHGGDYA